MALHAYLFGVLCAVAAVNGRKVCSDAELSEAQRAFRNCVESAKAGIVSAHGNESDEQLVCTSLEGLLSGCETQVSQLAHCTDKQHVENLKAIHLSSITDVLKAINHNIDVAQCSVYTEKTATSVTATAEPKISPIPHAEPASSSPSFCPSIMTTSLVLGLAQCFMPYNN